MWGIKFIDNFKIGGPFYCKFGIGGITFNIGAPNLSRIFKLGHTKFIDNFKIGAHFIVKFELEHHIFHMGTKFIYILKFIDNFQIGHQTYRQF